MTYRILVPKGTLVVTDDLFKDMRKKPVLAYETPKENGIFKVASFNNTEAMKHFLRLFGWEGDSE